MNIWELHPMFVHFPIAFLVGAVVLDLFAWWHARFDLALIATGLLIAGVITGWLAANFGLLAFYTVPAHTEDAHQWMYWHLGAAVISLAVFTWLTALRWFHRAQRPSPAVRVTSLIALAILMVAGYLGGQIVYHGGAGIEPELLATEIREGHSHGRAIGRAQGKDHEDHGGDRESMSEAHAELSHEGKNPPDKSAPAQKADRSMTTDAHAEHEGHATMRPADAGDEGGERSQAKQASTTTKQESDHRAHSPAAPRKSATLEADSANKAQHSSGAHAPSAQEVSPLDSPLGPDFERNVQENRLRNMP